MVSITPVDIAVNPNDTDQRYTLWGNGRIDPLGGAPAITSGPDWTASIDQPVAVALHISDWATGQGYVLDMQGAFHPLNGAPDVADQGRPAGVPYRSSRRYVDWSWKPDGSGQGFVLDHYGQLYAFGGATMPARTGPRWTWPAARKLEMDWTAGATQAITMDLYGGLHGDFTTESQVPPGAAWPGWDAARDLVVTDWSVPAGYTLDLYGGIHPFGGNPIGYGEPYKKGADVGRKLAVLSAGDPWTFWEVWSHGEGFTWTASTAPTVVAGGDADSPPATVTDTTRPTLAWSYSDAQSDSQAAWDLYVYDQAFIDGYTITAEDGSVIADPLGFYGAQVGADHALVHLSGVDPARRGVVADLDFTNGGYRFYVRAQDTSGRWSAWDDRGWTQNVPAPATPTNLTAVPDVETLSVALSVQATTGGSADTIAFGYSDDGGTTWDLVRGAEAVTLAATTVAADRDVPFGVTRQYRAVAYNDAPRVVSAPSNIAVASVDRYDHALTSTVDPTLGGMVRVVNAPSWTHTVVAGVFEGAGAEFPTVVDDGGPKARRQTITVETDQRAEFDKVWALLKAGGVLLLRDPFGNAVYCKVVGDITPTQVLANPAPSEPTRRRHLHRLDIPLVEVAKPTTLPVASTVPPGPVSEAS